MKEERETRMNVQEEGRNKMNGEEARRSKLCVWRETKRRKR